jgi:hypothetical protein
MKKIAIVSLSLAGLAFQGCNPAAPTVAEANTDRAAVAPASTVPAPPSVVLRAGTALRVRLDEAIDTRRNRAGDRFTATLDEPIVSGDRVVVPSGTAFAGHIAEAKSSGRFKGRAMLALSLDSFALDGRDYQIQSATSRVSRGHKKHNWLWIGGTSGGGALIGAAAAGGPAALIGAGAGAAAGTVGAAITGKRQINLPVESRLTFSLRSDVNIAR